MAAPPCMSDDGRPAVFVGTMLASGDAVALCDECLVPWTAAVLQAMTGVDPTPFLLAVSDSEVSAAEVAAAELATVAAGDDGQPDPPPPKRDRGRLSAISRAAGTDADQNDDAPPTNGDSAPPAA